MSTFMKLIMTLLVRDEIDIIDQNIAFHLAAGVDHVIVTDNGSEDGTRDVLAEYERAGIATVLDEPRRDFAQGEWVTRMALLARDRFGADWILNNDADEFWAAPSADLKSHLAQDDDVLACVRHHMVSPYDASDETPWPERALYRATRPPPLVRPKDFLTEPLGRPFFYFLARPKVLVRASGLTSISQGNHGASFEHAARPATSDIVIHHYPFRSVAQFERKVRQGGAAYLANTTLPSNAGWHWRRWFAKLTEHGLEFALADALPNAARLAEDIGAGTVVEERWRPPAEPALRDRPDSG